MLACLWDGAYKRTLFVNQRGGSGFPFSLSEWSLTICLTPYNQTKRERERNVLFNDALNTFYLRLYGVRHIVKDHSDSDKGNPLPPHRLLLSINSKGSFICTIPHQTKSVFRILLLLFFRHT